MQRTENEFFKECSDCKDNHNSNVVAEYAEYTEQQYPYNTAKMGLHYNVHNEQNKCYGEYYAKCQLLCGITEYKCTDEVEDYRSKQT